MKYSPPKSGLQAVWDIVKLVIIVCSFFWFGWQVGLLMIVLVVDLGTE